MSNFTEALSAIARMKQDGVVSEYAIGGAMALAFWSEPIPTFDLDVFVLLPSESLLVSLEPIYDWARRNDFRTEAEHILMAGVPVQVIPAPNALAEEAVESAAELDYEGQAVRVIRSEYLIALSTHEALARRLRNGKRELRRLRRKLPLPEKVAQVVELQRVVLPAIGRRRSLKEWERVWDLRES